MTTPGQTDHRIRPMTPADAAGVLRVYAAGIATGQATFATAAPDWPTFDRCHLPDHRFVAVSTDPAGPDPLGWVACVAVSDRCVYAGVVEHSVYVDPRVSGRGIGRALLQALIRSTERAGIWTLQAGIFPENVASLALHARCGFRVVGTRERIGRQHGRWRDVTMVERRSPVVD